MGASGSPWAALSGSTATRAWPPLANVWSEERWPGTLPGKALTNVTSLPLAVSHGPTLPYAVPQGSDDSLCPSLSCAARDVPHCPTLSRAVPPTPRPASLVVSAWLQTADATPPRGRPSRSSARLPPVPSAHPRGGGPRTGEDKTLPGAANGGNPARGAAPPSGRAGTAAEAGRPAHFRGRFPGGGSRSWAAATRIRQRGGAQTAAAQKHGPRETKTASPRSRATTADPTRAPPDPTRAPPPRYRPFKRLAPGIGCAGEVGR